MATVIIYSAENCPYCVSAKKFLTDLGVTYEEKDLTNDETLWKKLSQENNGWRTVPMVFIGKRFIGGYDELRALQKKGELLSLVNS